jgi:hypothetical protein
MKEKEGYFIILLLRISSTKSWEENYQRSVGIVGPSGYNRTRTSFGNATGLSLLPTWRIGRAILCYDLWPLVLLLKDLANL